jgi:hypothetical protein
LSTQLAAAFVFLASGVTAYLWSGRFYGPRLRVSRFLSPHFLRMRAARILCGLVLWELLLLIPVHIMAALQIAGLVGRASITTIALLQAVLLAGSAGWVLRSQQPVVSLLKALNLPKAPNLPPAPRPASSRYIWPRYIWAAVAVLAVSYSVFAIDLWTSFPSGVDALGYHLPLALRWLQTGSLAIPPSRAWRFSLSGNAEIGMMLLMATGRQWAVVLVNWIALATLAIATYLLAIRMGRGNGPVAATVTVIVLSIPIVEFQTFSAYVDLFGTAFLTAACALLLCASDRTNDDRTNDDRETGPPSFSFPILFLAAASCGISLGTKPVFYVYAVAFVLLAGFLEFRDLAARDFADRKKEIVRWSLVLCAGLLVPSLFWFVRGFQATGNPLYPMQVRIANHVILPGYDPSQITDSHFNENFVHNRFEWFIYPWTEWKRNPGFILIPYGEGSGVGALFASVVPIGLAFLFYGSFFGNPFFGKSGNFTEKLLLLALGVLAVVWWSVMQRMPRFGLPILVLACLLSSPLIAFLQAGWERRFGTLLLVSLVITCTISSFVPLHELLGRLRTGRWTRAEFYEYPPVIDRLPPGSCVLNRTGIEEKNFALAGSGLTNCVVPAFEAPSTLTREFLLENHVAYVAEIANSNLPSDPNLTNESNLNGSNLNGSNLPSETTTGLVLLSTAAVQSGEHRIVWRIWKVE